MALQAHSLRAETISAAGTVAAQTFVGYDGNQASTQGQKVLGVARYAVTVGQDVPVDCIGSAVVVAGAAINVGDPIITDNQGRAIPATGPLKVGAGATEVTSTAANGAILTGSTMPEYVIGDSLSVAAAAGALIEILFRR